MLVRGQCRAKELRVVQVDGDGRLLGDALALQKVVAHLEPLVAPGHHGDVFGRLDGEVVFDRRLGVKFAVRPFGRSRNYDEISTFNQPGPLDLLLDPIREVLLDLKKGVQVAGVDRLTTAP